jgi:hypothetical protein
VTVWFQNTFEWIHRKNFAGLKLLTIDTPINWFTWIWVLNLDVLVEWKWLLSFSDNYGLKVNSSWINKESRFDTNSLDSSSQALNWIVETSQFQWKNKVLWILDALRLEKKNQGCWYQT